MTTVWNLTELSELEEPILTTYMALPRKHRPQRGKAVLFGVMVTVAATVSTMVLTPQSNAQMFTIPCSVMAVAHSGIEQRPPLESVFADRFEDDWSEVKENNLLLSLGGMSGTFAKNELEEQAVESIFFNQQEDMSSEVERLSKEEIRKILRQRKLA